MRQKAENFFYFRNKKLETGDESESHGILNSIFYSNGEKSTDKILHLTNTSRPSSIASSSGFASLVSGNLGTLVIDYFKSNI